jgi:hypothetical protein
MLRDAIPQSPLSGTRESLSRWTASHLRRELEAADEGEAPIPLKLISSETFETGVLNLVDVLAEWPATPAIRTPKTIFPSPNSRTRPRAVLEPTRLRGRECRLWVGLSFEPCPGDHVTVGRARSSSQSSLVALLARSEGQAWQVSDPESRTAPATSMKDHE